MSDRKPTPEAELYRWHSAALRGEKQPVFESDPMCGWYVRSYSYRGLLYPGMIFMHQPIDEETGDLCGDEELRCVVVRPGDDWSSIAGHEADPLEEWTYLARMPISKSEYTALMTQILFSHKYIGPSRPFVRWFDEREQAADFLRYQGEFDAVGTN
jgi:hypothetical protein